MKMLNTLECSDETQYDSYEQLKYFLEKCFVSNLTQRVALTQVLEEMSNQYKSGLGGPFTISVLLSVFVLMMLLGALGNALVIFVVVRRAHMRSPRNVFIVNLAISDLILCLLTEPFNLIRFFTTAEREWMLGNLMCKISSLLQGTNICVSTISISAIALDRFQVIVHPTSRSLTVATAVKMLVVIWIISVFLASPLLMFSQVIFIGHFQCSEKTSGFSMSLLKLIYSSSSAFVLYLVPLVIVVIVYAKICIRIRKRMNFMKAEPLTPINEFQATTIENNSNINMDPNNNNNNNNNNDNNNENNNDVKKDIVFFKRNKRLVKEHRQRKTNILLLSIALIFALSWLPLISFNLLMDVREVVYIKSNPMIYNQLKSNFSQSLLSAASNSSEAVYLTFPSSKTPLKERPKVLLNRTSLWSLTLPKQSAHKNNSIDNNDENNSNNDNNRDSLNALKGQTVMLIQAACLLAVLGSACINPILYGWLNENFQKEFKRIFKLKFLVSDDVDCNNSTRNVTMYSRVANKRLS